MEPPILVAVMGLTGAGKSSFVQLVTGDKDIQIGHGLKSSKSLKQSNTGARLILLSDV
jgi:ABC-type transport system involved in cytochrome bd biosynthesis fused ATPase/permease subunit